MDDGARLHVTVVHSPAPRQVREWVLELPQGATVLHAIAASAMTDEFPSVDLSAATMGIWGRKVGPNEPLQEGDRVEVYRPLLVDPKVARRERFRAQGSRGAGLFAKKPPAAKPGP